MKYFLSYQVRKVLLSRMGLMMTERHETKFKQKIRYRKDNFHTSKEQYFSKTKLAIEKLLNCYIF